MTDDPVVVLAATARGWAGRLRAHAADHGGVVIRATVLSPEDALAEQAAVVLVDDVTSFLTAALVRQLQERGRSVLGMYDPGDAHGKGDLVDAGVDALVPADADPEELVAQVHRLASRSPADRVVQPRPAPEAAGATTRLLGITGPPGGVGITEVALEAAAVTAAAGRGTALLDLDESAPAIAQRLGLAVHPNLHGAVTAVERGVPVAGSLQRIATRRVLDVLPGMPAAEDWERIRPGATAGLIGALGGDHDAVVADLGHCPERVEGPTGLRFGHGLALAGRCTAVLVLCRATPASLSRTLALVARLGLPEGRLHLAINAAGRDRFVVDEAVAELRRATGAADVGVIREDPQVPRAAWQGSRVARGRFRTDVAALLDRIGWVPR